MGASNELLARANGPNKSLGDPAAARRFRGAICVSASLPAMTSSRTLRHKLVPGRAHCVIGRMTGWAFALHCRPCRRRPRAPWCSSADLRSDRWLARSQSDPRKAVAELSRTHRCGPRHIVVSRGACGRPALTVRDDARAFAGLGREEALRLHPRTSGPRTSLMPRNAAVCLTGQYGAGPRFWSIDVGWRSLARAAPGSTCSAWSKTRPRVALDELAVEMGRRIPSPEIVSPSYETARARCPAAAWRISRCGASRAHLAPASRWRSTMPCEGTAQEALLLRVLRRFTGEHSQARCGLAVAASVHARRAVPRPWS